MAQPKTQLELISGTVLDEIVPDRQVRLRPLDIVDGAVAIGDNDTVLVALKDNDENWLSLRFTDTMATALMLLINDRLKKRPSLN